MNSDKTQNKGKKDIQLNLSLENINKVLSALGFLQYNQVYDLIEKIRVQTELNLAGESSIIQNETNE